MTYTRTYVREVIKFAINKLLESSSREDSTKLIDDMLRDSLFTVPNPRVGGNVVDASQSRSTLDIDRDSTTMDLVLCRNVYGYDGHGEISGANVPSLSRTTALYTVDR